MQNHNPGRRAFLQPFNRKKNTLKNTQSTINAQIKSSLLPEKSLRQDTVLNTIDSILETINSPFELEIEDQITDQTDINKVKNSNQFIAKIDILQCMAYHSTICQICKDICPTHISFSSSFYPEIKDSCIGCQKCIDPCPSNAISLEEITLER